MTHALPLLCALLLDALLGEPEWLWSRLPHPAVLMGRAVAACERALNSGTGRKAKGIISLGLLIGGAAGLGWLLSLGGFLAETIVAAVLLAQKSLVQHVQAVADGLRRSVEDGRTKVALIVSRDTAGMDTSRVSRSAIESAAENLSDGVIAPAFWFLIAGLPGLLVYKVVNTADSMIGYRTPRYEEFGWAAARTDDVLNLVPARLTALLIALPGGVIRQWAAIVADARLHRSPNAGWPEAAMARVLDVALAGPRSYDGEIRDLAWVHSPGRRDIGPAEIDATVRVLWIAWGAALLLVLVAALV